MLTHKGTKTIETDRLILRQFTMEDAEPMFRNWASDDEVTRYLSWQTHRTVAETKAIISGWVDCGIDQYIWAITLKSHGNEPIGSLCITKIDEKTRMAHVGYALGRAWWNRGIMSEALTAVIDYLFDEVGFNRIESRHDVENIGSGAVMRKCGMTYEGRSRQSHRNNLGLRDMDNYAILAGDEKRRKNKC